jgi:hypothetical protein
VSRRLNALALRACAALTFAATQKTKLEPASKQRGRDQQGVSSGRRTADDLDKQTF